MQSAQFELHARIEDRHWWFVARRRIMRTLIGQVLPPSKETTIVDVGCGTGANIASLADDYRCVGIDTSRQAIDSARARFPQVKFIHGYAPADLEHIAADARMFLLMDVLEHVPDDFQVLSQLLAAATPGAHFLITVPADLSLWSEHDESFGHYRRYDDTRLRRAWEGLPVKVLLTSHYNTRLRPLIKLIRTVSRLRGHAAGASGTDFNVPASPINRALENLFAGESRRLVDVLHGQRERGYRRGVSLIALLQREPGDVPLRTKPLDLAADRHDPMACLA